MTGASWRILQGDALAVLSTLQGESVQCCVTSPPYWGLRDYGVQGQLGLERTSEEYVTKMVEVFREVRRVLRSDGTLWLNLGDSYVSSPRGNAPGDVGTSGLTNPSRQDRVPRPSARRDRAPVCASAHVAAPGLKPKDLVGIPWRVAFALQADGWWLRSDIIWAKPNPMPESVRDRPTRSHEYVFLLTKGERYFYDADAIREPAAYAGTVVILGEKSLSRGQAAGAGIKASGNGNAETVTVGAFRNRRSVWTITTKPFAGAHFAVMPWDVVEPCVLAGSRPGDEILDPFTGAGTVGMIARRHGRSFIGIELNPAYIAMAERRIVDDAPLLNTPAGRIA